MNVTIYDAMCAGFVVGFVFGFATNRAALRYWMGSAQRWRKNAEDMRVKWLQEVSLHNRTAADLHNAKNKLCALLLSSVLLGCSGGEEFKAAAPSTTGGNDAFIQTESTGGRGASLAGTSGTQRAAGGNSSTGGGSVGGFSGIETTGGRSVPPNTTGGASGNTGGATAPGGAGTGGTTGTDENPCAPGFACLASMSCQDGHLNCGCQGGYWVCSTF